MPGFCEMSSSRINREVLDNQRAEYGKQIVATVSQQLQVASRLSVGTALRKMSIIYLAFYSLNRTFE